MRSGPAPRYAAIVLALLWPLPLLAIGLRSGSEALAAKVGLFFGQAALVTFGGACAVLPYVAQAAVETHGWLDARQMADGLALVETTPGPVALVLEFVGFMAGWNAPGALPRWLTGLLLGLPTLWMTFVPRFALAFAGAPHVERIAADSRLRNALAALNAVVLAAIAQLAGWYAWTCWSTPVRRTGRCSLRSRCWQAGAGASSPRRRRSLAWRRWPDRSRAGERRWRQGRTKR